MDGGLELSKKSKDVLTKENDKKERKRQKMAKVDRPQYIIKVHRNYKYGPRARFWDIQKWYQMGDGPNDGYWSAACRGGLAYTEWGMWRAINKKLKKLEFGYQDNYFTLDRNPISKP